MIRLRHKILLHAFQGLDQLILIGVFLGWYLLLPESGKPRDFSELLRRNFDGQEIMGMALVALGWYLIFASTVRYQANRFTTLTSQALELIKANSLATFLLFIVLVAFGRRGFDNGQIILFWATSIVAGSATRILLRLMLMRLRSSGKNNRHILFVGTDYKAVALAHHVAARPELGYRIEGFLSEENCGPEKTLAHPNWPILGTTMDMRQILEDGIIDEVMICLPLAEHFLQIYKMIGLCQERGVVVRIRPEIFDVKVLSKSQVELFEGEYIVTFFRENLLGQLLVKRLVDMAASVTLLLLLSPLMLLVAILIKLDSPGPILFVQERIGMNKRRFRLLKFRSMVGDAEERRALLQTLNEMDGPVFKVTDDPRITRVGKFIRHASIDELPQLINVLKGEMSLVGPRPPLPSEVDQYEWINRKRISIMPGITCLWQISGRNDVSFQQWMELDRQYIETWSLWLDLKILVKTIPVVVFGKGAR
jgi:exopolysaccharide biosynthesis polyprenyl glycosylphosphotransferase